MSDKWCQKRHNGSKGLSKRPKMSPRRSQESPNGSKSVPKRAQERQDEPQRIPSGTPWVQKRAKVIPKWSQSSQRGPKRGPQFKKMSILCRRNAYFQKSPKKVYRRLQERQNESENVQKGTPCPKGSQSGPKRLCESFRTGHSVPTKRLLLKITKKGQKGSQRAQERRDEPKRVPKGTHGSKK